jgi:hypothetical protein
MWETKFHTHTKQEVNVKSAQYEVVRKVHGLVAVRRCYVEGGGDCYAKL